MWACPAIVAASKASLVHGCPKVSSNHRRTLRCPLSAGTVKYTVTAG